MSGFRLPEDDISVREQGFPNKPLSQQPCSPELINKAWSLVRRFNDFLDVEEASLKRLRKETEEVRQELIKLRIELE